MATDLEVPSEAPPRDALSYSSDSSDDEDDEDDSGGASAANSQVEWLATGRARRSTAGNRMKSMIAQEAAAAGLGGGDEGDSDLELLFAEADDDEGFSDAADRDDADGSDAHMDSSSDDDDDAKDNDLEGEKELERVAKEKRAALKKRKAQQGIPAKFRKRVRIESTPSTRAGSEPAAHSSSSHHHPTRLRQAVPAPPPRPKKKSERTSWLPSVSDLPTRASERSTTRMGKEQLHQQMVEREVRRKKQLEVQEKKAKRLELLKKPPMTQADRLREAELVEQRNSKSLNRWEEAEKQREEERERKLAALYNRTLEGPVVTFWTGIMELSEGEMKNVGRMVAMEEKVPRRKKQPAAGPSTATEKVQPVAADVAVPVTITNAATNDQVMKDATPVAAGLTESTENPKPDATLAAAPALAAPVFHQAVFQPIDMSSDSAPVVATPTPAFTSSVLAPPVSMMAPPIGAIQGPMQMPGLPSNPGGSSNVLAPPNSLQPLQGETSLMPPPPPTTSDPNPATKEVQSSTAKTEPHPPPAPLPLGSTPETLQVPPPQKLEQGPSPLEDQAQTTTGTDTNSGVNGKVTRSCIVLQNFDEEAIKDKTLQTQILFGRKFTKLAKPAHAPHCVITNHLARYKDPRTGLPFASMNAYKEIRRLTEGEYKWSGILGTWVGTGDVAAKGVPSRFLHGGEKEPSPPPPAILEAPADGSLPTAPPLSAEPKRLPATPAQAATKTPNPPATPATQARATPTRVPVSMSGQSGSGPAAITKPNPPHTGPNAQAVPPLRPVSSAPMSKPDTVGVFAAPKPAPEIGPTPAGFAPTPTPTPVSKVQPQIITEATISVPTHSVPPQTAPQAAPVQAPIPAAPTVVPVTDAAPLGQP